MEEIPKRYNPGTVENTIYETWIAARAFSADPHSDRDTFCMVIPPPNVTSALHLGHALNNTLQDVLIRFHRMCRDETLWMPGTDHAGIATQTVVEKRILTEEGRKRTDFERGEFVRRIQAWKDEYEATIIEQLRKMGCSCDWDRTRFTMDRVCAKAVHMTFYLLFEDELIYRGKRLVNWDPATRTVLADDEVEHRDIHGHFWYLRYPLVEPVVLAGETIDSITVGTTRPETMLGDTAVAMNPSDARAGILVGKKVRLPIVDRIVPIIADEHVVLPEPDAEDEKARYSTGFLKVTPAHDPDDYRLGEDHGLPMINVMAPDATISLDFGWRDAEEAVGPAVDDLVGLDRFAARKAVVAWFEERGLLAEIRDYTHSVGHSYRSHVPIEPYLTDQWYIAVKKPVARLAKRFGEGLIEGTDIPRNSLAGLALAPLLGGRLRFIPDRYGDTYRTWLQELRDWPISRQLWWGHRIPVWNKAGDHRADIPESAVGRTDETDDGPVTYLCIDPEMQEVVTNIEKSGWQRDEDVLDTWFSSALWPFSTLGWPENTPELDTFYPGNVLSTAREIITLWVSRMVMMGQYCAGDIPFSEVFIHAMIQDGQGRKMSKSLGNGVNPLDIIKSHGADAMRFTLVSMTTQTQDVRMPIESMTLPDGREVNSSPKFDSGRNLCNKLWNAVRFIISNTKEPAESSVGDNGEPHLADRWILSRLNRTIQETTGDIEHYRFKEYADTLYHFMWDDFCDWYLEIAKIRIQAGDDRPRAVLLTCLDALLRLMHPIMPFVTEELWRHLNTAVPDRSPEEEPHLIRAAWPTFDGNAVDADAEAAFGVIADAVKEIRNARKYNNIPPGKQIHAITELDQHHPESRSIASNTRLLETMAGLEEMEISYKRVIRPSDAAVIPIGPNRIYLLDIIDTAAEKERLEKEIDKLTRGIRAARSKLDNDNFINKAPADVVDRERRRLQQMEQELQAAEEALSDLLRP